MNTGFLAPFVLIAASAGVLAWVQPHQWRVLAQTVLPAGLPESDRRPAPPEAMATVRAAEAQIGTVTSYDPAYADIAFPGGDVTPEAGVCTDVLVRALRLAHGIDLQALVNRDMKRDFAAYPANWGLRRPDANIDHRRVPNLQRFLERQGAAVNGDFQPGDIVTSLLPGNLTHLVVVSDRVGVSGDLMIIHNIGAGTQVEDRLREFQITGHYRLDAALLAKLTR